MTIKSIYKLSILLALTNTSIHPCYNPKKPFFVYLDEEKIHHAVASGDLEKVKAFIKKEKSNLEDLDGAKNTPLHVASREGKEEIIKFLIEKGANIEARKKTLKPYYCCHDGQFFQPSKSTDSSTPLIIAAENDRENAVKILLKNGANIEAKNSEGNTALHISSLNGNSKICKILLENGANIEAKNKNEGTPLQIASQKGHTELIMLFAEKKANLEIKCKCCGHTPLLDLIETEPKADIVKLFLSYKPNIKTKNDYGKMAIHIAAEKGQTEIIKILLNSINDEKLKKMYLESETETGETPLFMASRSGKEETIKFLIEKGANINAKTKKPEPPPCSCCEYEPSNIIGMTPLIIAAENDQENAVKILLKDGADIEAKDSAGYTALHLSSLKGDINICRILIENGADMEAENIHNETPLKSITRIISDRKDSNTPVCKFLVDICKFLVERGAQLTSFTQQLGEPIIFSQDLQRSVSILENYKKNIDDLLYLIDILNVKRKREIIKKDFIEKNKEKIAQANIEIILKKIKNLIFSKKIPTSIKTLVSNILFEEFSQQENLRLFTQITFNIVFLTDKKYKHLVRYAIVENLKDINNRSIFDAAIILNTPEVICAFFENNGWIYRDETILKNWLQTLMNHNSKNQATNPLIAKLQVAKKLNRKVLYKNLFKSCIISHILGKMPNMPPEIVGKVLGFYCEDF